VKDQRPALSALAHAVFKADRHRPEACVVVGNYYGLRGVSGCARTRTAQQMQATGALAMQQHRRHPSPLSPSLPPSPATGTLAPSLHWQDHEKAVLYFKRALRLNAGYVSAWTLMGHEYIELRNTAAAVECYRRAVQLNPLDYRAWYGLGNAYELLDLPLWALYYFKRSLALRPYDPRMWCALGSVYERVGNGTGEAITCYERALQYKDSEGEWWSS